MFYDVIQYKVYRFIYIYIYIILLKVEIKSIKFYNNIMLIMFNQNFKTCFLQK